jgi:serine phosphatase RsbU (regulator of sigma subunit)/pSer/pThr/pTyr-binding forkhead associated (FHA) protein
MLEPQSAPETSLELIAPDGARRVVRVSTFPFLIGRGTDTGNHLQLSDRRISRQCAALVLRDAQICIEDRGQRRGLFVNGERVENRALFDGDVVTFGLEDSFQLIFHGAAIEGSLPELFTRIEHVTATDSGAGGLRKLSLLLEATTLLHSQLPLHSILEHMVDQAISLTDADRGLLLRQDETGKLHVRLARQAGAKRLPLEGLEPSQTAVRQALENKSSIVTEDMEHADLDLKAAQSIIAQRLRAVVVIPLYAMPPTASPEATHPAVRGELLGVLYLDSRRPTAFSKLERQILDAISLEAASVLDNARLVERERGRQRMEQELGIAREIQQALLPREFRHFPHLQVTGMNQPCLTVGGDYFDVLRLDGDRTAFLIADVSGKGLGAALLTTMLQGALSGMTLSQDPATVFNHINHFLCDHSSLGRYATLFFAILDRKGGLEFTNAGHPSPLLLRQGRVEAPFPASGYPVGLIPEAVFTSATVNLEPGDTLVLFSDGITEAMDPDEQEFGTTRLKQALAGQVNASVEDLQRIILASVENFARGARQADDLTLLLIRYLAAGQSAGARAAS